MTTKHDEYIKEKVDKNKVYLVFLNQLDQIEASTINFKESDKGLGEQNSLDIGFKLFPIIESIAMNIVKKSPRGYLKELGYSKLEANLIYSMFRNGFLHNFNPYNYVYDDGQIDWGLISHSGTGGFMPHFPGYKSANKEFNEPADKAFYYEKNGNLIHATLILDALVSHIRYDLNERLKKEKRDKIEMITGKRIFSKMPEVKVSD